MLSTRLARLSRIALKADIVLVEPDDLQTQVPQIRDLAQATLHDMRRLVSGCRSQPTPELRIR